MTLSGIKISIGMNLQAGPWGGGNQFGKALASYLKRQGAKVVFDLKDPSLDIILLAEPRQHLKVSAYSEKEIFNYLKQQNARALVVHRINECDERKGSKGVNRRLMLANRCVDHTVFVSSWLKALFFQYPPPCASASVIRNGSERTIFHSRGYRPWAGQGPLKIVTHHWGANWLKGFDIYSQLDQLLADKRYRGQITFTYIGNLPQDFRFKHARHIEPQHGKTLAATIRRHHVYLTASQNEPGGNHQNEGANCGLPLLYRKSGCLPEYCHGFGLAFTPKDFEAKLQEMIQTYGRWVSKMADFPLSAQAMCAQYADLFQNILSCREEILRKRARWRQFSWRLHRLLFVAAL